MYRGGTSRAVMFLEQEIPPRGQARDEFLLRVMGSPHMRQIDGLGGGHPVTSKVAIVGKSPRTECDVDYTFAQVDVAQPRVDYTGVCGNISAAVGPFAIDAGLVRPTANPAQVRIYNTNIDRILTAQAPLRGERVRYDGDYEIDGVPGRGARILLDYSRTAGTLNGRLLPTGRVIETVVLKSGAEVEISFCDLAYPCAFIDASSLGASGFESAPEIEASAAIMRTQREIRAHAAVRLGLVDDVCDADRLSPIKPLLMCVTAHRAGVDDESPLDVDLHARAFALNRSHESMPGSGAQCLAAASRIPGSIVNRLLDRTAVAAEELRIGHPSGMMAVEIAVQAAAVPDLIEIIRVGMGRTARPILDGSLLIPSAA